MFGTSRPGLKVCYICESPEHKATRCPNDEQRNEFFRMYMEAKGQNVNISSVRDFIDYLEQNRGDPFGHPMNQQMNQPPWYDSKLIKCSNSNKILIEF